MDALVGEYLLRAARLPFELSTSREPDKALLIVETRPSFFLPHVVATAVQTHPGWHLYVFGTPAVHALLAAECKNYDAATRVTLDTGPRMSVQEYSRLMLSKQLWSIVAEEHVLVFQSDCVLVRPTPPAYFAYDYVGAVCGAMDPARFVINGGLSLRRRSAMLLAGKLCKPRHRDEAEDVALCAVMRAHPDAFDLPSMQECLDFAIESTGDPSKAVGLHGTDKYYAPPELVAQLLMGC